MISELLSRFIVSPHARDMLQIVAFLATLALLAVALIATGLWGFFMITTAFDYDGPFVYDRMLLPLTVFVLAAGPIKSLLRSRAARPQRQP